MSQHSDFKSLSTFSVNDLEAVRLALRGDSVIDWKRLSFESKVEAKELIRAHELDLYDPDDVARIDAVKARAVEFLRRHLDVPIPDGVALASLVDLMMVASGNSDEQKYACATLKAMHIIQHLDARELLFLLPISDEEVFNTIERKVYRVIGAALANGFPIAEFAGGRKQRDSLYTKLLSKPEVSAAEVYDKVRFRVVTEGPDDVLPIVSFLQRRIYPFNYTVPGQSKNTFLRFGSYVNSNEHLRALTERSQHFVTDDDDDDYSPIDNRFTASNYRVVHFVADVPVRVPQEVLTVAPPAADTLGRVIFVQTEFQVIDKETEASNEQGAASHEAYKQRQKRAVMKRLQLASPTIPPPKP